MVTDAVASAAEDGINFPAIRGREGPGLWVPNGCRARLAWLGYIPTGGLGM